MINTFKKLIRFILVFSFVAMILTFLSIYSENEHTKECQTLGIQCEKGQVGDLVDSLTKKASSYYDQIVKKFFGN